MKKLPILLSFFFIFFSSINSNAQMGTKGIKGGLNVSNIFVDGTGYNFIEGFNAGVFFRTVPIERVSLQVEILYSQLGAGLEIEDGFSSYRGETIRLNYISLPVLARINFANNKVGVLVGPAINYLAAAGDDANIEGSGEDLRGLYNDFDFTFAVGFEVDITSGILIGSRTSLSITDIMSGDNVFVTDQFGIPIPYSTVTGNVNNFVTQAYIGLIF